jgi:spore coat protein U-like protein
MKRRVMQSLAAAVMLSAAVWAQAAITCRISQPSPGFSAAYVPSATGFNITQTSFTVSCQRGAAGDGTTVNYSVAADNGLNPTGQNNRAAFGANLIRYDVYKDSACSSQWRGGASAFTGLSMTLGAVGVATSVQTAYWGCVVALQAGLPTGTYTDTVTMTLSAAGTTIVGAPFTFPVSIFTPSVCTIPLGSAPGNVVFAYTAFGSAQTASTTFGTNCTNLLPYTMALDATSGVVSGLNYTLAIRNSTDTANVSGSTGTGFLQNYIIKGTMPAGQAGTCTSGSCPGSDPRTLTITY